MGGTKLEERTKMKKGEIEREREKKIYHQSIE